MKISKIMLYHVVMKLKAPFETSFGKSVYRHGVLVQVFDDEGNTGWGEIVADEGPWYSYETVETAIHVVRDFFPLLLKDKEINHPEEFFDLLQRIRGHNMAKAGVEEAVWDLYSKNNNEPLYKALGGIRDKIVSGVSIGIQPTINDLVKVVGSYLEKGYKRIKIKIKPGWDVNAVEAIRKEYPDILLQVDANAAYTLSDIEVFKKLDNYNLLMIEQPLEWDDLVDHAELAKMIKTPICLDESIKSLHDAISAFKLNSCKIINIKPGRVGGLKITKEIARLCNEKGRGAWIGGMLETGIGRGILVASATLPGITYPNDISGSDRYYEEDIVEPPWIVNSDGTISVRNKPGIGVEVLEEKIKEKYSKKIIEINF
ncbi:MAG: o-succinylbenzoate synthase [Sulfolobaceae archaeon]|nr:o-succinylbenzoate synthase [Sulfolobaceae archaeon]